ncbi:MAG: DUF3078 domain-containing protein [Flavobacteriales bacterium]|nr:DUF3078 domain-containing protein [Flavobacteriales bacterium]
MLVALIATPAVLFAQDDIDPAARAKAEEAMRARAAADSLEGWKTGGVFQLNLTQVSLTNWAAGGFSSISGIAQFNGTANWKKGKRAWDNSLALAFGGQQQQDGPTVKTDDRIELNSKYGYELNGAWYLAGLAQFRTQFTEGFNAEGTRISHLLSPGYLLFGVGLDYKPNDKLSIYMSPATARIVIVTDETLWGGSDDPDLRVYGVLNGETTALEMGGYVRFQYQTPLAENITFMTRGDFFSNYLRDPQNIDVTWETLWTFKVNDWFAATLNTLLIYDHDTNLPKTDSEGIPYAGPATQFKQTLGLGLTIKL